MGAMPVFMTAISTILGAILFLRFGYAMAHVGLIGTLAIIFIGHLVTIPTALAVAEIATNQKVEGGGAYYMISRSFGLNIGAAIGITLFLSQAISVAFYVIAFAEACDPLLIWLNEVLNLHNTGAFATIAPTETELLILQKRIIGLLAMGMLTFLMLAKGANVGVKALYGVVAVLLLSLAFFFMGDAYSSHAKDFTQTIDNPDDFFYVFTIIFPAFTGIAAGLGLSGDLKDPKKSIPLGTLWATIVGIIVYIAVAFKLFYSASPWDLASDQLVMSKIAIWGPIIPIGLACAAISSALGSVMIAPRTLQALGVDKIFPKGLSRWFAKGKDKDNEPINSSVITCVIAFFFIAIGDINFVAQIISMFFIVTYGAVCLISFMEHFAADPSYRPTFKSKWYYSLFGALLCFYLMFKMNFFYAVFSIVIMLGIYLWVSRISESKAGLENLFRGVIFQLSRELQVYLQRRDTGEEDSHWRPFIVSISKDTFKRRAGFDLVRWLSHKYGFGTYIHFIEGFLSKETYEQAQKHKEHLVHLTENVRSKVYLDTIISPSYTSAIAQVIQLSGVSGKGNNLILFEYSTEDESGLKDVISNYRLLTATEFDVCVLRSSYKDFGYKKEIHIWISPQDYENSNLMILLAYILLGHPEWKGGFIKIFSIYTEGQIELQQEHLLSLIKEGRLPISAKNIELIPQAGDEKIKSIINEKSVDADLTIIGYRAEMLAQNSHEVLGGYTDLGNIMFVSAVKEKTIE
ncbi:MAG: amino acid permease [Flavobacteriales bacterium]|nr:MAG: amino acid permease [Flavobacteriales bacterium]